MPLKQLWLQKKYFLIPVIICLIVGIIFWSFFSKEVIHLTQNDWYSPFFDDFFRYGTYLGDGLAYVPVALILMFVRWRYLAGIIINALLVLLLVSFAKQVVFEGYPRPIKFFEEVGKELRLVEGVPAHSKNSFPSGHTTTAFAIFGFLAFIIRRHWLQFLCFIGAFIAGYSRIYLSQHFLEDVMAGAALGTGIAIASFYLMQRLNNSWADKSLYTKIN